MFTCRERKNRKILTGLGTKKNRPLKKSDRYPQFLKNSLFDVENYFFKFSILHNKYYLFPHGVKSNFLCGCTGQEDASPHEQ